MRAQRAQARAKQMRQNLFGSNLLNMSMYNAQQAGRSNVMPHHPGAQYAMNESYIPMGTIWKVDRSCPRASRLRRECTRLVQLLRARCIAFRRSIMG